MLVSGPLQERGIRFQLLGAAVFVMDAVGVFRDVQTAVCGKACCCSEDRRPAAFEDAGGLRGARQEDDEVCMDLQERPRQVLEDGASYAGQWRGAQRHGRGRLEREGFGAFDGQFEMNRVTGQGRLEKANGDVYDGQWLEEREHGQGRYGYAGGSSHEGQWDRGVKSGQGCEVLADGSSFAGQFRDGKRHGDGVYRSADGCVFQGHTHIYIYPHVWSFRLTTDRTDLAILVAIC